MTYIIAMERGLGVCSAGVGRTISHASTLEPL